MSKRKLLIGTGPLILPLAAFFVTHANKTFAVVISVYYFTCNTAIATLFKFGNGSSANNCTTTKIVGTTLFVRAHGCYSVAYTVRSGTTLSKTILYK